MPYLCLFLRQICSFLVTFTWIPALFPLLDSQSSYTSGSLSGSSLIPSESWSSAGSQPGIIVKTAYIYWEFIMPISLKGVLLFFKNHARYVLLLFLFLCVRSETSREWIMSKRSNTGFRLRLCNFRDGVLRRKKKDTKLEKNEFTKKFSESM